MKRLFSKSKRQNLVYIILFVWFFFGIAGFIFDVNFSDLAQYFATFSGPAMMYVWGETRRPHGGLGVGGDSEQ